MLKRRPGYVNPATQTRTAGTAGGSFATGASPLACRCGCSGMPRAQQFSRSPGTGSPARSKGMPGCRFLGTNPRRHGHRRRLARRTTLHALRTPVKTAEHPAASIALASNLALKRVWHRRHLCTGLSTSRHLQNPKYLHIEVLGFQHPIL